MLSPKEREVLGYLMINVEDIIRALTDEQKKDLDRVLPKIQENYLVLLEGVPDESNGREPEEDKNSH